MKTFLYLLMLIPLLLKTCVDSDKPDGRIRLAKVDSEVIYLDEAVEGMPSGLSAKDSVAYINEYLKNRIQDILVYDKAETNIPQSDEIDELVENYRRSLIVYAYQQEVMNEKMQNVITDTVMQVFYENNRDRFLAGHDLIKGIFIKVPKTSPNIDKLKKLYKKKDDEAFQQIETFCVQNGGQVEYFYDRWVLLNDILSNASYEVANTSEFLRTHSTLDVVSGDYECLLYVDDYVLADATAPYEYIKDEVRSIVANTRKTEFLRRFEKDLFREAEKKGNITYYKVNQKKAKQ
jgi:hypothetical protein